MVEDISFPKNLPKVSRTNRIKRTARQNKDNQKQPFQKYLNQNEDKQEDDENQNGQDPDKKKRKLKAKPTDHENDSAPSAGPSDETENIPQGKRIDIHA